MNLQIADGRAFAPQESEAGTTGVVLGYDLAEKLFPGVNPIGRTVRIHGIRYRVIGVVERQGNLLGISLDKLVVAPALSPIQREVTPPGVVDALIVKANSEPEMREAMDQTETIMRSRRHLRPRQDNNFAMETSEGVLDFWNKLSRILYAVGPGLVGIALVVGGIVIMNIMLMAVAERTREIGIRKSLGARRRDILRQFLAEATALATVGAALGIVTGVGLSVLLQAVSPLPASVSPFSIVLGVVVGGGVGVVAGVYPASRAARLDPITALRQEGPRDPAARRRRHCAGVAAAPQGPSRACASSDGARRGPTGPAATFRRAAPSPRWRTRRPPRLPSSTRSWPSCCSTESTPSASASTSRACRTPSSACSIRRHSCSVASRPPKRSSPTARSSSTCATGRAGWTCWSAPRRPRRPPRPCRTSPRRCGCGAIYARARTTTSRS